MGIVVSVLLVTMLIAPSSSAWTDFDSGLAVYVTYPDGEYSVGSELEVTVHVFENGSYYDPDEVELEIGSYFDERTLELTRVDTGRYEATTTILETDIGSFDEVDITATVDDGEYPNSRFAMDDVSVPCELVDTFLVKVNVPDCADIYPSPGQSVEFTVEVSDDGTLVDPDSITATLERSTGTFSTEDVTDIKLTRTDTGKYEGGVIIPTSVTDSGEFDIEVAANYTKDDRTVEDKDWVYMYVELLTVWVHITDIGPASAKGDLHVLDLEGSPVEGADVRLDTRTYDDDMSTIRNNLTVTTNARGKAPFTIRYDRIGQDQRFVYIEGEVVSGSIEQYIEGYLLVREVEEDGAETDRGFVIDISNKGPFELGTSSTLDQVAKHNLTPLASQAINYYFFDEHTIFSYGRATTGSAGDFKTTIQVPGDLPRGEDEGEITVHYQVLLDDGSWEVRYEDLTYSSGERPSNWWELDKFYDDKCELSIDSFTPGEEMHIILDHPEADGKDETAFILWGPGPEPDWGEADNMEWECWNLGWKHWTFSQNLNSAQVVPCSWRNGQYEATVTCPECLSEDDEYYIVGIIDFEDRDEDYHVVSLTADSGGLLGSITMTVIVIVLVVAVAIGVAALVIRRRKGGVAPEGTEEVTNLDGGTT